MFYIGGELAQSRMGLPKSITGVFQGLLLFALLACDTLIAYPMESIALLFAASLNAGTVLAIASLGLDIPVYPVKGYSLTVPLLDESLAPQSTVLDETYKVAVTRFDNRIRVGGMAELGGFDLRLNPARRATLEKVVTDLFPGGDVPRATFWTGLRPMTPDSTPIVGGTRYANLFLNTGHGTLGWTMACGSGKLISDM
eukprot:gene5644-7457_t